MPTDTLTHYLKTLDATPRLSRAEELTLTTRISKERDELFSDLLKSAIFKAEVSTQFLRNKRISVEFLPRQTGAKEKFKSLPEYHAWLDMEIAKLNGPDTQFPELDLTGNLAMVLLNKLEYQFRLLEDSDKLEAIQHSLFVNSTEELKSRVLDLRTHPGRRTEFAKSLGCSQLQLLAKLREASFLLKRFREFKKLNFTSADRGELRSVHNGIQLSQAELAPLKDEVISKNLRLVVARARIYVGRGLDFETLIQEGSLGLMKAVDKFHIQHKVKLSTYATYWIDQTILRAIANKSRIVRIPTHIQSQQSLISDAAKNFNLELNRDPTDEEISEKSEIPLSVVRSLKDIAQHPLSSEKKMEDGTVVPTATHLESYDLNPFQLTAKAEMREKVQSMLGELSPLSEKIMRLKFEIGIAKEGRNSGVF